MRKLIAGINMSLDGFCDHTVGIVDADQHQYFNMLLRNSATLLYGRTTYQMMESHWPSVVKKPTGEKATDDFAVAIQDIPKIVFSRTLKNDDPTITGWKNVKLATRSLKEEVLDLKQQTGGDILAGSPSLVAALTHLNLIDEYQLVIHPVIAGSGLTLFKNINEKIVLKLLKTKTFSTGSMVHYYEPVKK